MRGFEREYTRRYMIASIFVGGWVGGLMNGRDQEVLCLQYVSVRVSIC